MAYRNLTRERIRLGVSVGAVAFAVMLIVLIRGLYVGITAQATAYIRSVGADIWVAEAGTPGDFFHSVSVLPGTTAASIARVPGVGDVEPLIGRPVVFRHDGRDVDVYLLGVAESGAGAPTRVLRGRRVPRSGEIVVDRVFANNTGLEIGSVVDIRGSRLRVVGVTAEGNAVVSQFAWGNAADVGPMLGTPDTVNYLLVDVAGDADVGDVAKRIAADTPEAAPLTSAEFQRRNTADLRESFLPIVLVLVVIACIIGIAIIGLTIYTATIEKSREYGVLKAIGFSNRRLAGVVLIQALAAGVVGFVVGTALGLAVRSPLRAAVPSFVTVISARDVALVGVGAVVMSLIAAMLPLRPLAHVDPASVFRA